MKIVFGIHPTSHERKRREKKQGQNIVIWLFLLPSCCTIYIPTVNECNSFAGKICLSAEFPGIGG